MLCVEALFVISSSFAQIYFDTTEIVPAPNLVHMFIIKNSRGITKLTAASWSAPSPATQN